MKIGIITFHWGTNYGAVLQSYALQEYLKGKGYEVCIINYRPKQHLISKKTFFSTYRLWKIPSILKSYLKEQTLDQFRKKHLHETKVYSSLKNLQSEPPALDVYICGSDQVWNPYFLSKGEFDTATPAYFLDFGNPSTKRIGYAVSFGCVNYPEEVSKIAIKYVYNFDAISVRENSGLKILEKWGVSNAVKLADPTLLISKENYKFNDDLIKKINKKVFIYLLRNEKKIAKKVISKLSRDHKIVYADKLFADLSIEKWLYNISTSSLVITNSYHGMIFSIINRVPFAVVLASGKFGGMNDRFITLLSYLGLENRIIQDSDKFDWITFNNSQIDWKNVEKKLELLRLETDVFFHKALEQI